MNLLNSGNCHILHLLRGDVQTFECTLSTDHLWLCCHQNGIFIQPSGQTDFKILRKKQRCDILKCCVDQTSCVCRSSDTAISMPVYDKPASATANTRTMQDETATKSSSEKSSEATTESAQSEDASALIFPNPCSEQFDLSERDAVLFDAAVAARNRTPNADICIPEIGVYGTYEEAEKTVIVCHVCYHFYYGCDGTEHYTDSGAMQAPAKAVLEVSDDMLHCVSFELVPNGAGTNVWAKEFCGPLTDLASYFLSPEQDEEWPLENTMPSSEQLFREYIETYKKYT